MALLRFADGTREQAIPKEKAYHIWAVLSGAAEPENQAQADFISRIANIYLDRHAADCPASYLEARRHIHEGMDSITPRKGIAWSSKH